LLSAIAFVQSLTPWNAPTGVLKAIQEFNKADEFVAGTVFTKSVDVNTMKHIKMIKSDFDFNQKGGPDHGTALFYASEFGNLDVVDALLEAKADANICDKTDNSPLIVASKEGHAQIVTKLLLQENTDINKRGNIGWTALFYACFNGNEDVVDVLLDANADPNICAYLAYLGWSPLMKASEKGYSQIVQKLLNHNADISKKDNVGETALSEARARKRDEVVAILENFTK
jgi:ankyrin repeat protein